MRTRYSACIEMLFVAETDDVAERIRMAADAGLDGVEFWRWTDKDIPRIALALQQTGLPLTAMVAEPMVDLTDTASHDAFVAGLADTLVQAQRLRAPVLIVQSGSMLAGTPRSVQRAALIDGLRRAAEVAEETGIVLALEPLNTVVDHPGYFLDSTREGLGIVETVDHPSVRLLYDIYHAAVMGETLVGELEGRSHLVAHVHLADAPGRNEPGSGTLNWHQRVSWLLAHGYEGQIGLEYRPTSATLPSLAAVLASD